jgi:hypothetical protein
MTPELDATVRRKVIAGGKAIGALILLMEDQAVPLETRDLMRQIVDEWEGKVPEPAELREMAGRVAAVVRRHIGEARGPLTLDESQVLQINAQLAGLEFALKHQVTE